MSDPVVGPGARNPGWLADGISSAAMEVRLARNFSSLGPTAKRVLDTIADRMAKAAETYGDDFDRPADWPREEQCEWLDAIVYRAVQLEKAKDGSVELNNRVNNACQAALELWGETSQLNKAQEECGELIAAINHWRLGRKTDSELAEEVAGVEFTVQQVARFLGPAMRPAREAQLAKLEGHIRRKRGER